MTSMLRRLVGGSHDTAQTRALRLSERRYGAAGPRFVVTFSPAGYKNVQLHWIGDLDGQLLTREEVHAGFQAWLDTAPLSPGGVPTRTIRAWIRGASTEITFRTDWVAGFSVDGPKW